MAKAQTPPTDDQILARLKELKLELDSDIPYRLQNLFPTLDGWFINNTIKTKAKLVRELEPKLLEILKEGEEVLFVVKGVRHSFLESMFMGALWANLMNQTVFVLTNARMLMFQTNSKGTPKHSIWMIYYSEVSKMTNSWTGTMELRLEDKKRITLAGFPKTDRKQMVALFEEAREDYRRRGFEPECTQSMENLCNCCYEVVPKKEYECEACGATYWKPSELAMRSLLFPSWGDFLMKHYLFAVFELLGYLFGLMVVLAVTFGGGPNQDPVELIIIPVVFFITAHVLDAGITYVVASKGLNTRKEAPVEARD